MPKAEFSEYHPFARLAIPIRVIEYDIKNLSGSGNVATATTSLSHGLQIGDRIKIKGLSFEVIHTPGHTEGGMCLKCGDDLFM